MTKPASLAPYPSEFRARIIDLVRGGQTPEVLAKRFELEEVAEGYRGMDERRAIKTLLRI